jgi:hypothetical protein
MASGSAGSNFLDETPHGEVDIPDATKMAIEVVQLVLDSSSASGGSPPSAATRHCCSISRRSARWSAGPITAG